MTFSLCRMEHLELPQVGRYRGGEFYKPHYDAFDTASPDGRRFARKPATARNARSLRSGKKIRHRQTELIRARGAPLRLRNCRN